MKTKEREEDYERLNTREAEREAEYKGNGKR